MTIAPLVACLSGVAAAQERWSAADQLHGAWELHQGGRPLRGVLFERGWPTDEAHVRLTTELAGEPALALIGASVAPGLGLPITASAYEADRLESMGARSRIRDTPGLLRKTLGDYRDASGYTGSLPRSFVPSFLIFESTSSDLQTTYRSDDVATYARRDPSELQISLEGVGFALLAQASLARAELSHVRLEGRNQLLGRDGRTGFVALLAAHSALATTRELWDLVFDSKEREIKAQRDLLGLDEFRFHLPTAWGSALGNNERYEYTVPGGRAAAVSRLRGQAAALLGVCELAILTNPKGDKAFDTWRKENASPETHRMVVETALFLFRALRSLHVDVRLRRAISEAGGSEIQTVDLGLYLMAMQAFLKKVGLEAGRGGDSTTALLAEERGKAVTLISTLSDSLRIWQQQRSDGFYDVYSVRTNSADVSSGESLAANAFAIRGLLASHRALSDGAADSPHLEAASLAVAALDRRRWQTPLRAYTETSSSPKATLQGASAVLGALRELALATSDGRYLARYRQYLESLASNGFLVEGTGRTAPHLSAEVTFEAGSK